MISNALRSAACVSGLAFRGWALRVGNQPLFREDTNGGPLPVHHANMSPQLASPTIKRNHRIQRFRDSTRMQTKTSCPLRVANEELAGIAAHPNNRFCENDRALRLPSDAQ